MPTKLEAVLLKKYQEGKLKNTVNVRNKKGQFSYYQYANYPFSKMKQIYFFKNTYLKAKIMYQKDIIQLKIIRKLSKEKKCHKLKGFLKAPIENIQFHGTV